MGYFTRFFFLDIVPIRSSQKQVYGEMEIILDEENIGYNILDSRNEAHSWLHCGASFET